MYSSLNPGNNDKASLELSTSRNTINARYSARPWYSVAASYTAATEGENVIATGNQENTVKSFLNKGNIEHTHISSAINS